MSLKHAVVAGLTVMWATLCMGMWVPATKDKTNNGEAVDRAPLALDRVLSAGLELRATTMFSTRSSDKHIHDALVGWLPKGALAERQEATRHLARALQAKASPSGMRVLFLEHLNVDEWSSAKYETLIFYSTPSSQEGSPGGPIIPGACRLGWAEWQVLNTFACALLAEGLGGNNGITASTALDVVVVHLFDGHCWRVGQYYNFQELSTGSLSESARHSIWLFSLLHCVNLHVKPVGSSGFMFARYRDYVTQIGRQVAGP